MKFDFESAYFAYCEKTETPKTRRDIGILLWGNSYTLANRLFNSKKKCRWLASEVYDLCGILDISWDDMGNYFSE